MSIELREFLPGDETAFRRLNEAWIAAYFKLEAKDQEILNHPQQYILEYGGHIYFAIDTENKEIVGCCALVAMEPGVFEVAKMAVLDNRRGEGIGRKLLRGVIKVARELGATRLYLETNHTLTIAISLYAAEGFTPIPKERVKPSPYERATVFMEKEF